MLLSIQRFAAVVGMLLLLLTAASGQTSASNSPIDAKMRQADARLNTPVTFSADRIYLGELLEALSVKTGVALSMDDTDAFSGTLIACDLKQTPLADVMNSVWSLVGSKSAAWEWRADIRQTPIRYAFRPTLNARSLGERLHQAMRERFEAQAELLTRLASMSPADRQAHAEDLLPFMENEDPHLAGEQLKTALADEDLWTGMRLFGTILSADQRRSVLNGETIGVPLDSLPQEQRRSALAMEEGRSKSAGVPAAPDQKQPSETITFGGSFDHPGHRKRDFLVIMIGFASKQHSSSQGSFGMNTGTQASAIFADWMLPGDVRELAVETRAITALPTFEPEEVWSRVPFQEHNLAAVATIEGASFIAVVRERPIGGTVPAIAPGKTPRQYFSEMWQLKQLMHKWRDGVLLAHYPQWFYGDEAQCPYGLVKRLRIRLQKQGGLLSLEDVAEPITTLRDEQLNHLTEEFPFSGEQINSTEDMRGQERTALCAFYRRYPKALSERGLLIDLKMRSFFQDPTLWPKWLQSKVGEDVTAVRIVDVPGPAAAGRRHTYTLQMTSSTQSWRDIVAFNVVRIAPKP